MSDSTCIEHERRGCQTCAARERKVSIYTAKHAFHVDEVIRDPIKRPRKGDVLAAHGCTYTVESVDFDGTGERRWTSPRTRIYVIIDDPTAPATRPDLAHYCNSFDLRTFAALVDGATIVKGYGLKGAK